MSPSDRTYIRLEHVEARTGRLLATPESVDVEVSDSSTDGRPFRPGDVLFGKLRPYLAKVIAPDFEGLCSSEFLVLRSAGEILPRMLAYQLLSSAFIAWVDAMTYGTKMPRADPDEVANLAIAVPSLDEQRAIVAFLDRETAKVDVLIAKKERLIELLQAKRNALVTSAVTRGLDTSVPMKNSGVDWLGEIPAGWVVRRLKALIADPITDGPHETPDFLSDGVPFLSVDGIQEGELIFEGCRYISEAAHKEYSKKCAPRRDDILLGKAASTGKIARVKVDFEFSVWSPLALIRADYGKVWPGFLEYALKSAATQAQIDVLCTSNTQKNISMKDIPVLVVCVPEVEEQRAIAAFLDRETERIDVLVAMVRDAVGRLEELRTALISAAVTGQVDVREALTA